MANVRKVKDFDELSRLIQERVKSVADRLQPLNGKTIRVGIDPQEKYPEGTAVAQVARWIEYGTARMLRVRLCAMLLQRTVAGGST